MYKLISITFGIYRNFDKSDETGAISKTFDKVLHEGLIHKLESNGISGNQICAFEDYLFTIKP